MGQRTEKSLILKFASACRPVILPDYAKIDLRIPENSRGQAWVCFDGKQRQELQPGDYVNVRMSPNPVPTINKTDQTNDWFTSLERCFGWNERVEQRSPPKPDSKSSGPNGFAEKHASDLAESQAAANEHQASNCRPTGAASA